MFPFTIKFQREIKQQIDSKDINDSFDDIIEMLQDRKADFFTKEQNKLRFENRFSKLISNINLMGATDGGYIEILRNDNLTKIVYQVNLTRIIVIGTIFSIIVFFTTLGDFGINGGLIAFVGFVGLNWLITAIRHFALSFTIADLIKMIRVEINPSIKIPI